MGKIIDRTGETNIAKNGMKMTIIAYRSYKDIDIQFEDRTIIYNKSYDGFKKGYIKYYKHRVGETNIANNGMKMTIINCRKSHDIDIQFEDGTIVYNKQYGAFKRGVIKHPNIDAQNIKIVTERTGKTRMMNCGLKATIINYHNCDNIDVQFEDSTAIYNKRYAEFKKGEIGHPNIINTIKLKEVAYKLNNDWYYICSHPTWMEDKILSVKEIYAYQLK